MKNNYYQEHNERLQKTAHTKLQSLPEKEKNKRQKKALKRHQNFIEKEKEKQR